MDWTSFFYSKKHVFNHEKKRYLELPVKHGKKRYIARKRGVFMNIHKHLRNFFLVSTALFWANCSSDSDVSSPATTAEGQSSSQDSIDSSSSVESSSETSAEQSSSSEKQRKYTLINKSEFIPDSCEPNQYGITPGDEYYIEYFANSIGQSRIEEILSDSSAFADSAAQETKVCLKSVLDTISHFAPLYGTSPYAVLDVKCSDGSTYFSQLVKNYAKQQKITEEEAFQVSEQYDRDVKDRLQKIKQQIDSCLQTETEPFEYHCTSNIADDSKEECAIEKKPSKKVLLGIFSCHGNIAKNNSGKDVEMIECDNGEKWEMPLNHSISSSSQGSTESSSSEEQRKCKPINSDDGSEILSDSCESVLCYNDTAKNEAGTSFDIIECDDGKKYLREPIVGVSENRLPLPEGVGETAPQPTSSYAANCTPSSVCIDKVVLDEFGNPRNEGGCVPTTECPSKPEQ